MLKPVYCKNIVNSWARPSLKSTFVFSLVLLLLGLYLARPCLASHDDECIEYSIDVKEELSKLPDIGSTPHSFTPEYWQLEKTCYGDLNRDGKEDLAIVIVRREGSECFGEDIARSVIVAFGIGNGEFKRVAVSNGVARLECAMMADVSLSIDRGSLLVSNLFGARELVVEQCRFRYSPKLKKFQLIGQDKYECDRLTMTGKEDSRNLLTGDRITEVIESGDVVLTRKSKFKKMPLPLFENVSAVALFATDN